MLFLYSVRSPHRTAKPSRDCPPLAHPRALPAVILPDRRSPSAMFEIPFECCGCKNTENVFISPGCEHACEPSSFGSALQRTLNRALRRMAGLVFLSVAWVLAGACRMARRGRVFHTQKKEEKKKKGEKKSAIHHHHQQQPQRRSFQTN